MTNNGLDKITTIDLMKILIDAYNKEDQALVNIYAYELAYRLYSIKNEFYFGEVLKEFGYKNNDQKLTR